MSNLASEQDSPVESIPYLNVIVPLQRFAIALSALLLFASVLVAPVQYSALGGVLGVPQVMVYSVAVAFFAAQHTAVHALGWRSGKDGNCSPATRWARYAFLCMFLLCVNGFVTSARGLTHWGVVAGHDEPQYYAYLHSWFFDHDVNFENELKRIAGAWELMSEAHPERAEYNVAPIGSPIVWAPVYLAAHVVLLLLHATGVKVPTDGISAPYAFACAFASSLCVYLGMLMVHATLRRWFSEKAAFLATVLLWVASPIIWYQTDQPWMSHAPSFFAAALVFWVWIRSAERRGFGGWLALFSAIGLAMLVRPTHAVLLILPVADLIAGLRARSMSRAALVGFLGSVVCLALVYSIQVAVWASRYHWLTEGINTPPGSPMAWTHPAILSVLFSAHHGLFAWHPVLLFGFVGLVALWRRTPYVTVCVALVLIAYVYANAAIDSWAGGGSFGMRRFVCILPFMAPGIAAFGAWFVQFCRKRPLVPVTAVIVLMFIYNVTLMLQLRTGWTPFGRPASFQQVWSASASIFHDIFGNPFSYPANLLFAWEHHVSPSQYDVMSGIPMSADLAVESAAMHPYLGTGWQTDYAYAYRLNGAFAAQEHHTELFFYMHQGHAYDMKLTLSLPTQMKEPQGVQFTLNGHNLGKTSLPPGNKSVLALFVPGEIAHEGLNVLNVDFATVLPVYRTGSRGEPGGHGLELPTRKPYEIAAMIWKIEVATHYDAPSAKSSDEADRPAPER